jgi:hypothetical protein
MLEVALGERGDVGAAGGDVVGWRGSGGVSRR